jgi:hypothetical protein
LQYRKAKAAENKLNSTLSGLPNKIVAQLGGIIQTLPVHSRKETTGPVNGVEMTHIRYADVNNDSRNELLVEYPAGAHGIVLNVYGWKDHEFTLIGGLSSGTPEGFEVGDFDDDGRIEITSKETDWDTDLPYVSAPRMTVMYRWNGRDFEKLKDNKELHS